ncbi:MAG: hypothetical protein WCE25_10375, partial [Nitrososphaeraceae archaeon]
TTVIHLIIQIMDIADFTFACDIITQVHCFPCPTTVITFQFIRVKCRTEISTKTPFATLFFHNQSGVLRLIAFSTC